MPEPGWWMPLVAVSGTLWRSGESELAAPGPAATSDTRRSGSAIAPRPGLLIVQVITGFLRIVGGRGLLFGRLGRETAPGSCRPTLAWSQWKSTELPGPRSLGGGWDHDHSAS
jgi:hypothetical protein